MSLIEQLRRARYIDLTHPFNADSPHFNAFPQMQVRVIESFREMGVWVQEVTHVGQWGTHVDPPAHLAEDAGVRTLEEIDVREMVLPLCVLDMHGLVAQSADTMLTVDMITHWESVHGIIPAESFVAIRSDWYPRWSDTAAFMGRDGDGVTHWPGIELEAVQYLLDERGATALGHETLGTDGGLNSYNGTFPAQRYISESDHWQIEVMAHLDAVPPTGAVLVASWPKMINGAGFPARVFAIVPD